MHPQNKHLNLTGSATDLNTSKHSSQFQSIEKTEETPMFPKKLPEPPQLKEHPPSVDSSDGEDDDATVPSKNRNERSASGQLSQYSKYGSKSALYSPVGSMHSFDLQVSDIQFQWHLKYFIQFNLAVTNLSI